MRRSALFLALCHAITACAGAQPRGVLRTQTTTVVAGNPRGVVQRTAVTTRWLQGAPVQTRVLSTDAQESWVGLWVDPPAVVEQVVRAPVDVALVVDTSGSMAGAKIQNARTAAASFIQSLAEGDIVSLYAFSDGVTELAAPTLVNAASRAVLLSRVQQLVPTGSTNLYDGLRVGTMATASAPASHAVRRVVVISDGRANVGPSSAAALGDLAAQSTENGTQVTAIGVGLDYDEATLGALAVRSAGRLYHLEEPSQMAAILQGELDLLGQTVAANAYLEVEADEGVSLDADAQLRVDRRGNVLRIPLGSLYAGQRREVLLHTRLPGGLRGARTLASARLRFEDPRDPSRVHAEAVDLRVEPTEDAAAARSSANERVVAMVASREAAAAQLRASQYVNNGQMAEADAELQRAEARLRSTATQYEFSDDRVQGALLRQAQSVSTGRAAVRHAASAPSPVARRAASLHNSAAAMHDMGY
ncbi:MAG: VWA domain-containing protein [Myxococcales bacterium]|nr:VWA domain-containing protein [Myxococcales bacterium]